jgi:hypothetical protein
MTAAIDSVKPRLGGLPVGVVEARLVSALRGRDAFVPMETVRSLARSLSDPWWPLKHPVQVAREIRDRKRVDPESARCEAEADELADRLDGLQEVEQIRSWRTFDGMVHKVTIHPWYTELADRVHRLASPISVHVKPRT